VETYLKNSKRQIKGAISHEMGNNQGGILRKSPLSCLLAHWKDIAGTGGIKSKRNLIKYCNQWWPLYKLENGVK